MQIRQSRPSDQKRCALFGGVGGPPSLRVPGSRRLASLPQTSLALCMGGGRGPPNWFLRDCNCSSTFWKNFGSLIRHPTNVISAGVQCSRGPLYTLVHNDGLLACLEAHEVRLRHESLFW